jgi:hypothetical protein
MTQAIAQMNQTRICVLLPFVAQCIWNRSGKYGFGNLYFAIYGAVPLLLLSIQFLRCEKQAKGFGKPLGSF